MAVKRAIKLTKQEFDDVKIIEKRYELIEKEYNTIGEYKLQQSKKLISNCTVTVFSTKDMNDIGKIELYINKKVCKLQAFINDTEVQNRALAESLQNKYGEGVINPDKGTFVPR